MSRRHNNAAWVLLAALVCAFLSACNSGSSNLLPPTTGGGGGQPGGTGAPVTTIVPPPQRDSQGYDLTPLSLNAVPNGSVSGLGIGLSGAAPAATHSLAALTPSQDVVRIDQNVAIAPAETTLTDPGGTFANTPNGVFVATSQRGTPGAGDVYLREETSPGVFTYSVVLNSAADVALVASDSGGAVAAIESASGQPATLYRYAAATRTFVPSVALGTLSPSAITSWPPGSADVYVGGSVQGGGSAQLTRVRATATEVLAIPSQAPLAGEREEVTGFAPAKDDQGGAALLIVTALFDAGGAARTGQLLLYDGADFTALGALSGDGPLALAFTPEDQVYVGTDKGQLLYYDPAAGFLPEPGFPAVTRVTSLLARDGASLLVGCQTTSGALLVVRTRRSP